MVLVLILVIEASMWILNYQGKLKHVHFWMLCEFYLRQDLQAEMLFLVHKLI